MALCPSDRKADEYTSPSEPGQEAGSVLFPTLSLGPGHTQCLWNEGRPGLEVQEPHHHTHCEAQRGDQLCKSHPTSSVAVPLLLLLSRSTVTGISVLWMWETDLLGSRPTSGSTHSCPVPGQFPCIDSGVANGGPSPEACRASPSGDSCPPASVVGAEV